MKSIVLAFVLVAVLSGLSFSFFLNLTANGEPKVLSEEVIVTGSPTPTLSPEPTESPSPTPTEAPTLTPTPKARLTPTPTAKPIVQPQYSSQEINGFIERFSAQYGVDPNAVRHIAICESGFNPLAEMAGYAGLFQFGKVTWANIRKEFGEDPNPDLRYNAEEAVQTAAYALSRGKVAIWPNCIP